MKFFLPMLLVSGLATANDAAILRCRAIPESAARLACYDALVVNSVTAARTVETQTDKTPKANVSVATASSVLDFFGRKWCRNCR